jgi:hypothetical protein
MNGRDAACGTRNDRCAKSVRTVDEKKAALCDLNHARDMPIAAKGQLVGNGSNAGPTVVAHSQRSAANVEVRAERCAGRSDERDSQKRRKQARHRALGIRVPTFSRHMEKVLS